MLGEPLAGTAAAAAIALLELVVGDDAALSVSTRNMRPGCSRPFCDDLVGGDVEHADLGRHDDQVVLRDVVARGPQAVAVEDRADADAVGEGDRRRAVPRLHEAGVVLVERPLLRAHRLVPAPRLGDHHHHGVRQRAAGEERAARARCRTSPSRSRSSSMTGEDLLHVRRRTARDAHHRLRGRASS